MLELLESKYRAGEAVAHMSLQLGFDSANLGECRLCLLAEVFDEIGDAANYLRLVELASDLSELCANFVPKPVEFGGHWLGVGLLIHALLQRLNFLTEVVDMHPGETGRLLDTAHLVDRPKAQVFKAG